MTHEQIDEQMVDFLYGELPADARAAFESHVAGCERCRREVESFGRVRSVARTVLDEPPPPRAHDAILRAAREAAAAAPAAATAAVPAKETQEKPKKAEPARASLWDWLRGRWAFPALATVGALTVFILGSRLFLNPNTVREIGRPTTVSEPEAAERVATKVAPALPVPAPSTVAEAAPAPEAPVPARAAAAHQHVHLDAKKARSDGAPAAPPVYRRVEKKAMSDDPLSGFIGPPASVAPKSPKREMKDDRLDELSGPASGGAPRDKAAAHGGGSAYAQPPPPAVDKPLANVSPMGGKSKKRKASAVADIEEDRLSAKEKAASDELLEGAGRAYAPPPSPATAPAQRYAEEAPAKAAAEPENSPAGDSAELAKSLPRRRAPRGSASAPPAMSPAPVAASRSRSEEADAEDQAVVETLAQRAERLFTQGRWAEAAIAYRDLLKQQPNSPNAQRWRRRLAAARAAVATGRPPPPSAR